MWISGSTIVRTWGPALRDLHKGEHASFLQAVVSMAENFAGVGGDAPRRRTDGHVAGDVRGVVENEQRIVGGVFSGPIEAAAGHGLVAADGKIESDGAFAETPETGLFFGEDGADGVGAGSE